jgi:hypothetical protein
MTKSEITPDTSCPEWPRCGCMGQPCKRKSKGATPGTTEHPVIKVTTISNAGVGKFDPQLWFAAPAPPQVCCKFCCRPINDLSYVWRVRNAILEHAHAECLKEQS